MKRWRDTWPLGLSVLLHLAILAACLVSWDVSSPPPPPPLPEVDLLLPVPVPPMPEEAAPSPAEAPPKPVSRPAVRRSRPPPIAITSPQGEQAISKPTEEPPQAAPPVPAAGTEQTAGTTVDDPSTNAVAAGPPPDYLGLIRSRLEKVKRYPPAARAAGAEGTVMLGFVLARSGRVVSWRIAGSSGVGELDEEAGEMIGRAGFPPFPPSLDQDELHLVIPVEFFLKDR